MKQLFLYFICCLLFHTSVHSTIDLEDPVSPFILETKKIEIEGYEFSFNPSIVMWNDQILLCFRIRDPLTYSTNRIGLVFLNNDMEPEGKVYELEIEASPSLFSDKEQDPRLIVVNNKLYAVYNNEILGIFKEPLRRMIYGEIEYHDDRFIIHDPQSIIRFEGETTFRKEKNWVPFDFEGNLLLSYSLQPHHVLFPIKDSAECVTISTTRGAIDWKWGELRGGTPALLIGDQYLAFFHSSKNLSTLQSDNKFMLHYFMGAYTFNMTPPFEITSISPKPIVGKKFYNGPVYKTWKPLRVVFPGGFIVKENKVWVAYGRQDHEIWLVKMDLNELLNSLIPVKTVK